MPSNNPFTFAISLSVLDHLGRNLYRSFATVIGEAISNSWDADAENVYIYIDRERGSFFIKDDGVGMEGGDFQEKFLKIGYSKRKEGVSVSAKGRPFIGRKGIGKLALLSCAKRITVISKTKSSEYIGGVIDNSGLDQAITDDLKPHEYSLEDWDLSALGKHTEGHTQGTIIYFESIKDGIRHSADHLKKIIALYFKFSLLDDSFSIFVNDEKITHKHLADLAQNTEFLWNINDFSDPYVKDILNENKEMPPLSVTMRGEVQGFIASVCKPRDLKIQGTDERVSLDLFVNGRLREKDILKHIPTARIAESYLYGQVHFNQLDDEKDRFTSSREGIVADDQKYKDFLDELRKRILEIVASWDKLRITGKKDGDPENESISTKKRKSLELFNAVSAGYELPKDSKQMRKVDAWVSDLSEDAAFNFESYAECFVSENLIRRYIREKNISLSPEAKAEIAKWQKIELESKNKGNISIDVRRMGDETLYLSMADLAFLVDKKDPIKSSSLSRDANEYKPLRDAVAHTALLTDQAKHKLTTVYENIKARIRTLLS